MSYKVNSLKLEPMEDSRTRAREGGWVLPVDLVLVDSWAMTGTDVAVPSMEEPSLAALPILSMVRTK
jgi:hypothetical protein